MAEVALEHITKVFPGNMRALHNVNLQARDGELLVLVGPSGCGKTTALRIIAGLEGATQGTVRIGSRDVSHVPSRYRDVAMAFQRPALYPHLTVRENLRFSLRVRSPWSFLGAPWGCSAARIGVELERVTETARLLKIDELLDRRPGQLSGGQQQRVALGRALVRRAAVTLLDEPLSHLDFRLRAELRRELHLLHRSFHGTMLYVTHDPAEAMTLADRVVVLEGGVVQQVGTPGEVYERPASTRVAEFFGWPPMNLLAGEIADVDGRRVFRAGTLVLPGPREAEAVCGRAVTLGIRPENVQVLARGHRIGHTDARPVIPMRVELLESLGNKAVVTLRHGDRRLVGAIEDAGVTEGMDVDTMIDMAHAHLFDSATGLALVHGERTG